MKNKILFILIILLLWNSGCAEMPNDSIPSSFNASVLVTLSTGKNSQQLYLSSVMGLYDDYRGGHGDDTTLKAIFIKNAKVTVNGSLFKQIDTAVNQYYYYYGLEKPGFIQPDNEYNLLIITDKGTITGKTKVPKAFSINSHPKESICKMEGNSTQVKVTWERSPDAKGYVYQIKYPILSFKDFDGNWRYGREASESIITKDTCFNFEIKDRYLQDEYIKVIDNKYTIFVGAYDENYEDCYVKKHYSCGLNGAYGVFASMAMDSIVINVIKK